MTLDAPITQRMSLQDETLIYVKLAVEWKQLLDEIHHTPGFHGFLRSPPTSYLLRNSSGPIHIPLRDFSHEQASALRDHMRNFLSWHRVRMYTTSLNPGWLWWCSTCSLAFLPLHAVGIYTEMSDETSPTESCVSHFAVSSYTPAVNALIQTSKGPTNHLDSQCQLPSSLSLVNQTRRTALLYV